MPNWTVNYITCKKETASKLLTDGKMDFNRFRPRPKEYDRTSSGSVQKMLLELYFLQHGSKRDARRNMKKHGITWFFYASKKGMKKSGMIKELKKDLNNSFIKGKYYDRIMDSYGPDGKEIARVTAEDYIRLFNRYGALDWYEWNCRNWGTKWNACDTFVQETEDGMAEIRFDTAWCVPYPILTDICRMFPDEPIRFEHFSDESLLRAENRNGILTETGEFCLDYIDRDGEPDYVWYDCATGQEADLSRAS